MGAGTQQRVSDDSDETKGVSRCSTQYEVKQLILVYRICGRVSQRTCDIAPYIAIATSRLTAHRTASRTSIHPSSPVIHSLNHAIDRLERTTRLSSRCCDLPSERPHSEAASRIASSHSTATAVAVLSLASLLPSASATRHPQWYRALLSFVRVDMCLW